MTDTKGGFLASMIPSALWGTGVPRDPSSLLTWHPLGTPNWRTQRIQRGERRGPRKLPRFSEAESGAQQLGDVQVTAPGAASSAVLFSLRQLKRQQSPRILAKAHVARHLHCLSFLHPHSFKIRPTGFLIKRVAENPHKDRVLLKTSSEQADYHLAKRGSLSPPKSRHIFIS